MRSFGIACGRLPVFARAMPSFDVEAEPEHPALLFCDWLDAAIDAGVREPGC